jgi:WD40 repeat protein/tRNA A-37 threonylcarbamoyl transferase component Bud32
MPSLDCVSEADLRAFQLGELPGRVAALIADHLEACPACAARADELDSAADACVVQLRRAAGQASSEHPATQPAGLTQAPLGNAPPPGDGGFPRWFGDYELLGELGQGGMSVVYLARQRHPARVVALKLILPGRHTDAERRARFLAEADAIGRLQHPNIVQIYQAGEHEGQLFLALEWLDGGSLAQRLDGNPQDPAVAAALVERLAQAVQYAHDHGIIHRDLKPANILFRTEEKGLRTEEKKLSPVEVLSPVISDFGLAKQDEVCLTATGAVLGTPAYMAPEQAGGDNAAVGPAADVYALGAVLYELLAGRPPFKAASTLETLDQVRHSEPVPPSQLQPKVPRDLETICLKCLHKEPGRRYATAAKLAGDLQHFLAGRPIQARPAGTVERLWRWFRRNPVVASLTAAVVLLLATLAAGSSWSAWRLLGLLSDAEAAKKDAMEQLFEAKLAQARAGRLSNEMGQRFATLRVLEEAARLARSQQMPEERFLELRTEAIACLALPDLRVLRDWPAKTPLEHFLNFDASLERYAHCDLEGNFLVREVADPGKVLRLPGPGQLPLEARFHFSPDGRFLAVRYFFLRGPVQTALWDLGQERAPHRVPLPPGAVFLAFRPDGREVALAADDTSLCLYDMMKGQARSLAPGSDTRSAAYHPNGRQLALTHGRMLQVVNLETGKVLHTVPHPAELHVVAWSGDGRLVAAACDDRRVYLWDAVRSGPQAVLEGHLARLNTLLFNAAGDLLASGNADGTTRLWDAIRGRPLLRALGCPLRFSPDGRRLAFQNGSRTGIWEVADGRECRVWHLGRIGNRTPWIGHRSPDCVAFSPDGRLLTAAGGGGVRLYDVAAAAEIADLPGPRHARAFFHPDGTRLFTYGKAGLYCWPIHKNPKGPARSLHLGPARNLDVPADQEWLCAGFSRDGRWAVVADGAERRVLLLDVERPAKRKSFPGCPSLLSLALSPDGRWLAAGLDREPTGIKVWDTASGQPVRAPDGTWAEQRGHVAFSPDGRWLVSGGERDYRFWKVGSWEAGPVIPRDKSQGWFGPIAFSQDGRLLALARSLTDIELYDVQARREVATLTTANPYHLTWLCFSPDDSLLAAATGTSVVQLWDLRTLRVRLREIDLDWDRPPYPTPAPVESLPLRLEVKRGTLGER